MIEIAIVLLSFQIRKIAESLSILFLVLHLKLIEEDELKE